MRRQAFFVFECTMCAHRMFPQRLLCPRCGRREFRETTSGPGILEEVTTSRTGAPIGSVRTDAGPVVLARLDGVIKPGMRVQLADNDGVVASPSKGLLGD